VLHRWWVIASEHATHIHDEGSDAADPPTPDQFRGWASL
jgi:hypothetical protein